MAAITHLSNLLNSLSLTQNQSQKHYLKPFVLNLPLLKPHTFHIPNEPTLILNPSFSHPNEPTLILNPSFSHPNVMFFKSGYNVQVIVDEHEHEEKLIQRFRKEVLKAGIIQESKRRRYFENNHDKVKRKTREAAKRNARERNYKSRWKINLKKKDDNKQKSNQKMRDEDDGDNWEVPNEDAAAHDYLLQLSQTSTRWHNDERGRSSSSIHLDNPTLPSINSGKKKKWNG